MASLPSPFPPLLPYEKKAEWAREYQIGRAFARDLDLYRAITSYKRSLVLLPADAEERRREIEYSIALSYYLGGKYAEAVSTVENGSVGRATSSFPAYRELLTILYESYVETDQPTKACLVMEKLKDEESDTGAELALSSALKRADFPSLMCIERTHHPPDLSNLLTQYCACRKSVGKAQQLNALLPGLGYAYVGQKQSALTAFLLNGLFIFGAVEFFCRGYYAAGAFVTSLEFGWYCGGIYGAGEAAHTYNKRLYERLAGAHLCQQRLFPIMKFSVSF